MQHAAKIAISLPSNDFEEIEQIRENMGVGRSAIIRQAVHFWLEQRKKNQKVRCYEEGYRKTPENIAELKSLAIAQTGVLNPKGAW